MRVICMYAEAKFIDSGIIPVVDISALYTGTGIHQTKVAQALHAASQGLGFIYIKGHGLPVTTIRATQDAGYAFFRAEEELKNRCLISQQHRGWLRPGASKMQDHAKADLKESFIWGQQDGEGVSLDDHALRGPNQWPDFAPSLEVAAMEYFSQAHKVALALMRGFALGLKLPEDFFLRNCVNPLSRASMVYYPAQPEDAGVDQFGVAPHTDFGVLTLLCQDDTGGLQVQTSDGDWVHAPPIEDTLVVNVGDLLSRWTNGAYKSTPHRVVNRSGHERLSIVLAFDPDPETLIDPRGSNRVQKSATNSIRGQRQEESENTDQTIGLALRDLRENQQLSARQLADLADISAAMISRIENGQVSPSIATMTSLSQALGVPLASLFRDLVSERADYTHVKQGEGVVSTRQVGEHMHHYVNLASHRRRDLHFDAQIVTLVSEQNQAPHYVGHGVVFLHVLRGVASYLYGKQEMLLSEGDSLSLDAELSHGVVNVKSAEFVFLSVQAESRR